MTRVWCTAVHNTKTPVTHGT